MEVVSLKDLPREFKVALLDKLGFELDPDSVHIVTKEKHERVRDPYSHADVRFDRMMILPGSAMLLDDNEFSLFSYIQAKGDIL